MESTRARIQNIVQSIYETILEKIPKDVPVEPLLSDEELEGVFAVFFTNKGNRGLSMGSVYEGDVLEYLDEVVGARQIARNKGKTIVSSEDVAEAQQLRKEMEQNGIT
jgi:hypothetical protein